MRRRHVLIPVLLAALALPVARAAGYGTIIGGGQNAEHMRITLRALTCPAGAGGSAVTNPACFETASLNELAGQPGTTGGVGMPDLTTAMFLDPRFHFLDGDYDEWTPPGTPPPADPAYRYPQTAAAAHGQLDAARTLVRNLIGDAVTAAGAMRTATGTLDPAQVTLSGNCPYTLGGGNAKCQVIEAFGTALHIVQDFYAHSNWTDIASPPFSDTNVSGLGMSTPAPYLALSGSPAPPRRLITGCISTDPTERTGCSYGKWLGSWLYRARHLSFNKDFGTIGTAPGTPVGPGTTPRGRVSGNFERSVMAAAADTQDKWLFLRTEMEARYGKPTADLLICAIVRDTPMIHCGGRVVGLVIDSSGSNTTTDPKNLRISAALSVAASLTSATEAAAARTPPDLLTVVDFDDSASVVYPLGDPDGAGGAIGGIDSSGGTYIASGIRAALQAMGASATTPFPAGRAGIVVLTDGEDSNQSELTQAVNDAGARGVRVSFGHLSPVAAPVSTSRERTAHEVSAEVRQAVAATGGVFAQIGSAEAQQGFMDMVGARGLTGMDGRSGTVGGGGTLVGGLVVTGSLADAVQIHTWTHQAAAGEGVKVTVTPPAGMTVTLVVEDDLGGIAQVRGARAGAVVTMSAKVAAATQMRFRVRGDAAGIYSITLASDPSAPPLRATALLGQGAPPVRARGRPIVSLRPAGRAVSTIRRGRVIYVRWPVTVRATARLRLTMYGPRGVRKTLTGSVRKGARVISARLTSPGARRGVWTIRLWAGGYEMPVVRVLTR